MKLALKNASAVTAGLSNSFSANDIAALKSTVSALKFQLEGTVLVYV